MNSVAKISTAALVLAVIFPGYSQVSELREIGTFSSIVVASGISLNYEESEKFSVMAEAADPASLKKIITELRGSELRVYGIGDGNPECDGNMEVTITGNGISSFTATSRSKLRFKDPISSETIRISVSDGASFVGKVQKNSKATVTVRSGATACASIDTGRLSGEISGGSMAVLSGTATHASLQTASGAHCDGRNLATSDARITAKGSSSIAIYGRGKVSASAEEGSSISYFATPSKISLGPDSMYKKQR